MKLQLDLENINLSTEKFISKINDLKNDWAPLKELLNVKQKLQNDPWITLLCLLRTKINNTKNVSN